MSDQKTKLDYTVTPGEIYYTRDSENPSIQILTIGATNSTAEDVDVSSFELRLPVNNSPDDPDAITDSPDPIIPVSLQVKEWDFQKVGDGLFRATPVPPVRGVGARKSIVFQLKNIIVNEAAGVVLIRGIERGEQGNLPIGPMQVTKIKSDLDIKSFDATPTDVKSGDPSTLAWRTQAAARVTLSPGSFPDIKPNDSVIVKPEMTTVYTLTAFGEGPNISKQVTVQVPLPRIKEFSITPSSVNAGDDALLKWEVENANYISITPGDHKGLQLKGSLSVPVTMDTTFILLASNLGGQSVTAPASVSVKHVNIKSFKANPGYAVQSGEAIELTWEIESATSAIIQPGSINIQKTQLKKGSWWVTPTGPTVYTLIAQNSHGHEAYDVNVLPMPQNWHLFSSSAPFDGPGIGILNYQTKIWLLMQSGRSFNSWDGQNWVQSARQAAWQPRVGCGVAVFNGRMWLFGGKHPSQPACLNDTWHSADGNNWTKEPAAAQWPVRKDFVCYVLPAGNKLFIAGGVNNAGGYLNDVWSTADGINWTMETDNAFATGGRSGMAVTSSANLIYLLGGATANGTTGETYYSADGKIWKKQLNSGWPARTGGKAASLASCLYFGFGTNNAGNLYDSYSISGSGCLSAALTQPANNISPFLVEYQGALWYAAGLQGTAVNKNVWAFNPPAFVNSQTQRVITQDFDVGPAGRTRYFICEFLHMPVGTRAGIYADKPGPDPDICKHANSHVSPRFIIIVISKVPANYKCRITVYAAAPPNTVFAENASIDFKILYQMTDEQKADLQQDYPENEISV